jgi:hypothetical protein
VSVKRLEESPLLGALNQKILSKREDFLVSVKRLGESPLLGTLNKKILPKKRIL